ncbi:MAG: type II secretion system F family protein [Cucumibacter sp.]
MSSLVLIILVAVSLGAVAFAFVPGIVGGGRADKRIKALKRGDAVQDRQNIVVAKQRESRRRSVQDVLALQQAELRKRKKRLTLQQRIYMSGMRTRRTVWIRNSVLLGVAAFIVLILLEVPLLFAVVFAASGGYLIPRFYLARRTKRFRSKFLDEFPTAVETIVRGVKSGLPLNDSIKVVAKETRDPVKTEFARVLDQQAVGKPMYEAVEILYERVPLPEVNFFVVVVSVQQQAGGNLSEALTNLARVLRSRKKMQGKVKAMSSEAKASALIIGSLPFIVGGLVSLTSPSYLAPLFTTTIGFFWLGIAAILMAMGAFVMNRLVQFDY